MDYAPEIIQHYFGTGATNSSLMNPGWLRSRLQQGIGTHVVPLNAEMTVQVGRVMLL